MKLFVFVVAAAATLPLMRGSEAPSFEAASIRSAAPNSVPIPIAALPDAMHFQGGPGTSDQLRIRYTNVTLQQLLARAYRIEPGQVSGPGWIDNDKYDINATLPAGTNQEQFLLMLQSLLNERFKLQMRHESRTIPVYDLTVVSGGPKLKQPEALPVFTDDDQKRVSLQASAIAAIDTLRSDMAGGIAPSRNFHIPNGEIGKLISELLSNVDRPIVDQTRITGSFSFDLKWTPDTMRSSGFTESYPDLFTALQQQLGLKLSPRKEAIETIVVENAERAPGN